MLHLSLGLKVVGVKSASLNEFETSPPQPRLAAQPFNATARAAQSATPIISGLEQVSINVSIVYLTMRHEHIESVHSYKPADCSHHDNGGQDWIELGIAGWIESVDVKMAILTQT